MYKISGARRRPRPPTPSMYRSTLADITTMAHARRIIYLCPYTRCSGHVFFFPLPALWPTTEERGRVPCSMAVPLHGSSESTAPLAVAKRAAADRSRRNSSSCNCSSSWRAHRASSSSCPAAPPFRRLAGLGAALAAEAPASFNFSCCRFWARSASARTTEFAAILVSFTSNSLIALL